MSVDAVTGTLPRRNRRPWRNGIPCRTRPPCPNPVTVTSVSLLVGSKTDHRTVPDAIPAVHRIGKIEHLTVSKLAPIPLNLLCASRNRWRSGTFASVNLLSRTETRPQFRFEYFAGGVARQRVDDLQSLRMLVPREAFGQEFLKIGEPEIGLGDGARAADSRPPAPRPTSRPRGRSPPPRRSRDVRQGRSRPPRSRCSRRRR